MTPRLTIVVAVLLDAATTTLGLGLGVPEAGPLASRLLPLLGPLYWVFQLTLLLGLYRLLRTRLPPDWAATIAALGPWAAGWHNAGLLLRGAFGV